MSRKAVKTHLEKTPPGCAKRYTSRYISKYSPGVDGNAIQLSLVVPAYNEEELLPEFVKEVTDYLKKAEISYELLIVENGSKDKTLEMARDFSKHNSNIIVSHLPNPSYGEALICGIKQSKGEYVIIFNVDFWDKKFIDVVKIDLLGYDIVVGSKNLPGSCDNRPVARRLTTKGTNLMLKLFLGFRGTDTHGIKIFDRRKIIPVLNQCKISSGMFDSELVIRAQRAGLKILELPVEVIEKRKNRFGIKRVMKTPMDFWKLYMILR